MLFSEHIRALRTQSGIPQRQLAQAIGVDVPMYSRFEHGERRPKRRQVVKLAQLLHTNSNQLVAEWLAEAALNEIGHDPMSPQAAQLLLQRLADLPTNSATNADTNSPVATTVDDTHNAQRAKECNLVASLGTSRLPHYRHGNAADIMAHIEDASVNCIVTTAPYWELKPFGTESIREDTPHNYIEMLLNVTAQAKRILKPDGSMWINIGDADNDHHALLALPELLTTALTQTQGWHLINRVVWNRITPVTPNAPTQLRRTHEVLLHFALTEKCFFDAEAMAHTAANAERPAPRAGQTRSGVTGERYRRRIQSSTTLSDTEKAEALQALHNAIAQVTHGDIDDFRMTLRETVANPQPPANADGRTLALYQKGFFIQTFNRRSLAPTDIWEFNIPRTDLDHYRLGPDDLYRLPISATCPTDGLVLDPFCGTGTVCRVAYEMGRRSIGIDINADLLGRARRINEQNQKPLSLF